MKQYRVDIDNFVKRASLIMGKKKRSRKVRPTQSKKSAKTKKR